MLRWLKLLPVLLAVLWLPFSAVAAVSMPFCQHGHLEGHGDGHDLHHQMQHGQHGEHGHEGHDTAHPGHADGLPDADPANDLTAGCDACGFCHLACAGLMAAGAASREMPGMVDRFAVSPAPTFSSRNAEPLPRPPRTA